jgi:NNP family nitrate/nitrite transporter-like MFS transporter
MSQWIGALGRGNWKSLFACFLYFDTGFTAWVMFGPLAPYIGRQLALSPSQSALLVAVPVLAAAIVRVSFGNLFQCVDGRRLALLGIALSSLPALVLLLPLTPGYSLLLVLGVFLGVGGASFAVALPMAGSSYPREVQGLVLGLAAAGNIGAVLDGFLFPALAQWFGWQLATAAVLPLLALAAAALLLWASDRSPKSGRAAPAYAALGVALAGLIMLVLAVAAGLPTPGKSGLLVLPVLGSALVLAVLPHRYRVVFAERDTWVMMLVYSITFGGFVGMSSYVSLLLTTQYGMTKIHAGLVMALLAFTGAMVRPLGGLLADRLSGVRVLLVLLLAIALANFAFARVMPSLSGGIALLMALYLCFGLGNGATFQLVPQRWAARTGIMTGIIGAAGGIGGFYLPVIMGLARESTGSYQLGFAVFAALAALAFVLVAVLHDHWLAWALPDTVGVTLDRPLVEQRLARQEFQGS